VLIVDDNAGFRRLVRRLLEDDGHEVVGAVEAAGEALTATERLSPEVVLLDVCLPDGSGFDVAARLVRARPGLLVLLTSSRRGDEFDKLAAASGAAGFVAKDDLSAAAIDDLVR
jgi:CheY-like chemotaxis protein